MDGLTSRTFWQKTSSYKCQFCNKIYASSLSDGWAKYKEKVPDVSDSSQNVSDSKLNSKVC